MRAARRRSDRTARAPNLDRCATGAAAPQPTITDCNLVLGYLDPGGLVGGALKLDADAARAAIARDLADPLRRSVEEAAFGMLRLASASMMRAIRAVSVERGRDPRQFALLAFGGNGPLFAAAIAAELGITRVIVPPLPGVFSAFGLLVADAEHHASQSLRMRMRLDAADADRVAAVLAELDRSGRASSGTRRLSAGAARVPPRSAGTLRRVSRARSRCDCRTTAISWPISPSCSGPNTNATTASARRPRNRWN